MKTTFCFNYGTSTPLEVQLECLKPYDPVQHFFRELLLHQDGIILVGSHLELVE